MHSKLCFLTAMLCGPFLSACQSSQLVCGIGSFTYSDAQFCFRTDKPFVALTIDDSPDPNLNSTSKILDVLEKNNAKATFFVIGDRVSDANREVLLRALNAGHELGNHTYSDVRSKSLTVEEFSESLLATHIILTSLYTEIGRVPSRWFRPGWGAYSKSMLDAVHSFHPAYKIALGNVFPFDTSGCNYQKSVRRVLRNVRPGSIIILHDSDSDKDLVMKTNCNGVSRGARTYMALDEILPELSKRGYEVVTLSEAQGLASSPSPETVKP